MIIKQLFTAFFLLSCYLSIGQNISQEKQKIINALDAKQGFYGETAMKIWEHAEIGFQEVKSCVLLQDLLKQDGFEVKEGVANLPTAFVASYGFR